MSEIEKNTSNWIETPLSKFGFKCVMGKHDFCVDALWNVFVIRVMLQKICPKKNRALDNKVI